MVEHTGFPLKPVEFVGKQFEDLGFPPDFCIQAHINIEQGFVSGKIIRDEFQQQDGRWIDVIQIPEKDASGQVKAIITAGRDITRLKTAQAALKESEEIFRALVENCIDGITRIDRSHSYLYVNPAMKDIIGIPSDEFLGKTFEELGFPEELCTQWHEHVESVFLSGKIHREEFCFPTAGGSISLNPGKRHLRTVKTVVSVARDIFSKQGNGGCPEYSERQFRALVENSRDAIMRIDRNHRYLYVNPIVEKQSGFLLEILRQNLRRGGIFLGTVQPGTRWSTDISLRRSQPYGIPFPNAPGSIRIRSRKGRRREVKSHHHPRDATLPLTSRTPSSFKACSNGPSCHLRQRCNRVRQKSIITPKDFWLQPGRNCGPHSPFPLFQ
jgi:PAS domain S-box-containing protein